MAPTLTHTRPDPAEVAALAARIESEDGAPPLSDQTVAQLAGDAVTDAVTHVVARVDDRLVGYAQRSGSELEVAAEPEAIGPLLDDVGAPPVLAWSHGRRSRLVPAFEKRGWTRARELFQLRRPLDDSPVPEPGPLPDGVVLRAFVPGRDDAAWLALNAAAFAGHPEQGRWTRRDLEARLGESWFDAAGFLLAERGGELVAFHWTKIHPDGAGEVYVLGVSPSAQGGGLGRSLLLHGLRYLASRGCPYVLLYVDGDNTAARRLYERDGFVTHDLDVQWRA